MEKPKLSVAFMPRDKYSIAIRSLESLVGQLPVPSQVVIFDTGYPEIVMDQLKEIVDCLEKDHIVNVITTNGFLNTNTLWNKFLLISESENLMCLENDVVVLPDCISYCLDNLESKKGHFIVPSVYEGSLKEIHFNPSVTQIIRLKGDMVRSYLDRGRRDENPMKNGRKINHIERHCFFTTKTIADLIGDFDEEMHCRTDFDLCLVAFKLNLDIYMPEPDLAGVVFHPKPNSDIDRDIFLKRWDVEKVRYSQNRLVEKHKLYRFKTSIEHVEEARERFFANK